MLCPVCREDGAKVIDSRAIDNGGAIRRRRECTQCSARFTTVEKPVLLVVKRNGMTEPFSQEKVIRGVSRACQGRDVTEGALKKLAQAVEQRVSSKGAQITTHDIGLAILEPLQDLDEVAYLRFASVYKQFESAEDFMTEIRSIRRKSRRGQ